MTHAKVTLSQVIIKSHGEIVQKAQGFLAIPVEAIEQIPGGGLFHSLA